VDVVVRELTEADAEALTRATHASLDHLRAWLPWALEEPKDAAFRREFIRSARAGGERLFAAFLGDEVVGCCGLHPRIGEGGREIGYWVHADHLRRGVATTMAGHAVSVAFADPAISFVEIHHEPGNTASGGVPAKLGFTRVDEVDQQGHVVWRLSR
jgi:RimJ/RimL family protein N-acetyltransferase